MDLLLVLVERATQVISKKELMAHAWPTANIDESTLRFHISTLRKALGDGLHGKRYITSVSGRGYCFVATVDVANSDAVSGRSTHPAPLPRQTVRVLGRDQLLGRLATMLPERRFVTLTGSGGMGKSTVALALAERLAEHYEAGIHVLDVTLVGDGAFLTPTLARQLGVPYSPGGVLDAIQRWLHDRRALIILDSCEAQLDACATLAQSLLERSPGMHLLCTSREPLRARGEWVLRLPPLGLPPSPPPPGMGMQEALGHPALQLLVERAMASRPGLQITESDLPTLCELTHRLDGMPLAIELAAVTLDALTLQDLLTQLDTRFLLRSPGHRTLTYRHRTLEALLDWSHERLTPGERIVLRRVSVFMGSFSLTAAQAVAADDHVPNAEVIQAVMGLASKSLLAVDMDGSTVRYRLLDSTRAYALELLGNGEDMRATRLRQCVYLQASLNDSETDWANFSPQQWIQVYAPLSHNVRDALAWAFGHQGDALQGIHLVNAAVGTGHQLSLSEEYRTHAGQALRRLMEMDAPDPELELRLSMAQASMQLMSQGPGPDVTRLYLRALEISQALHNDLLKSVALNGLFVQAFFCDGDYQTAIRHARAVTDIAVRAPELHLQPLMERLTAQALHGAGRHEESRLMVESGLRHPPQRQRLTPPFPMAQPVMMRMLLARILWLQGHAEQAWQVAEELMDLAAQDMRFALSNALAWTVCPLALWLGAHDHARQCIDRLYHRACETDMPFMVSWACVYDQVLACRLGAQPRLLAHDARVQRACASGVVAELLATVDPARITPTLLSRSRAGSLGWCEAEILRAEGERLLAEGRDTTGARALFERSLTIARQQRALAWELRTSTSLARLWASQGSQERARDLLAPVLDRFTEGMSTHDVLDAKRLLSALS